MRQPAAAHLLRAYEHTRYTAGPATIRVGARSATARTLLAKHRARGAVLLSAWNPMSRPMPTGWNQRAQRNLLQRLRRCAMVQADGCWRRWREEHVLVFGPAAPALVLVRHFRQRAVVVLRPDSYARLIFL